jgi:hypothetical protein
MENDKLHSIWQGVDSEINLKTIGELNESLSRKTRKTMNKFLFILLTDIIACAGLIVFLIITALNRQSDIIYLVNNLILFLITLVSLVVSIITFNKLHNNKLNLSLKEWLEYRIRLLSGWMYGKYINLYIVLIPVLLVMINLSIHVYFEYKPFIEVFKNNESISGLIAGFVTGLIVSYYVIRKIRKYQFKNLEFLKDLHSQLSSES